MIAPTCSFDSWAVDDMRPESSRRSLMWLCFQVVLEVNRARLSASSVGSYVREFVRNGGGVVGICAGAYLCTSHYDWSLHLMNAAAFNKMVDYSRQGEEIHVVSRQRNQAVDVEMTDRGAQVLRHHRHEFDSANENGPLLSPGDKPALPTFEPWALLSQRERNLQSSKRIP